MSNLYKETIEILKHNKKTKEDILVCQGEDFQIPLELFWDLAKQTDYDDGYGAREVARDLVLIGVDFWLSREEYDGSEWWEYREQPKPKPTLNTSITRLSVHGSDYVGWVTLKELNTVEL